MISPDLIAKAASWRRPHKVEAEASAVHKNNAKVARRAPSGGLGNAINSESTASGMEEMAVSSLTEPRTAGVKKSSRGG